MNKTLLPNGLHDLLYPKAGLQTDSVAKLLNDFESFGYLRVSPPAIEFEESLFAGSGKALEDVTFRLMDPTSHKMMGVRADMTMQVARIAAAKYETVGEIVRLSYAGDVFRVKGEGLYAERQFTQVGLELVGVDSHYADAETVCVAVNALKDLGVSDICVDFNLPEFAGILIDELLKLNELKKSELLLALAKKDIAQIENITQGNQVFAQLVSSSVTIDSLKKMKLPKSVNPLILRLEKIIALVSSKLNDVMISIDVTELDKSSYHKAIGFSIFSRHAKNELGRGGRYKIQGEQVEVDAVGLTLYMNELCRILPEKERVAKIYVPHHVSNEDVKYLQDQGYMIISAIDDSDLTKSAKEQSCDFVWNKGEAVKI